MAVIVISDKKVVLPETLEGMLGTKEAYTLRMNHQPGLSIEQLYKMLFDFNETRSKINGLKSVETLASEFIVGRNNHRDMTNELRFAIYLGNSEIYAYYNTAPSRRYLLDFLNYKANLRQITGAGP